MCIDSGATVTRAEFMMFSRETAHAELNLVRDSDVMFEAALAAIHGLSRSSKDLRQSGGVEMDTRQAEMLAMFQAYLGESYDGEKTREVLQLQRSLHQFQDEMLSKYENGAIDAEAYVSAVNVAVGKVFELCERVLGPDDFKTLFGGGPEEIGGYIDLNEFLIAEGVERGK
jgi:hypothetical protein